jgi:hypothetical protein
MVGNSLVPTIDELPFKIVKSAHLEMRQGVSIILNRKKNRAVPNTRG